VSDDPLVRRGRRGQEARRDELVAGMVKAHVVDREHPIFGVADFD
jgi:hypothetical protein